MIGRARHQQGCVSGMLLENVCIIFTSSGTAFHAVPVGADGPAFCRQMVERYSRTARSEPQPRQASPISIKVDRLLRQIFADLSALSFRRKIGAK